MFEPNYDDHDACHTTTIDNPFPGFKKEDTAPGFMVEKDTTKNRGSIAPRVQLTRGFIAIMGL